MKLLSRLLASMAALGVAVPGVFRGGKHRRAVTTKLAGKRSRCRLQIARGAGSISAKADITQLCNLGLYNEARAMAEAHERQCGERLFPAAWWRIEVIDEPA